jgi:hypothetical protein
LVESLNHCVAKRRASRNESGVIREMSRLVNSALKTREKRGRFQIGIRPSHALRSTGRFAILVLYMGAPTNALL